MKNTVKIIALVLIFAAAMTGAIWGYKQLTKGENAPEKEIILETKEPKETNEGTQEIKEEPLTQYKDFTVYTVDKTPVSLSNVLENNKPVIINYWATWCGYCKAEMPDFNQCYLEYGDKVEFMMIDICGNGNDDRSKAAKYVAEEGFSFPVYYDDELSALSSYYTSGYPTTIVFDAKGNLLYNRSGMLTKDQLEYIIEQITNE